MSTISKVVDVIESCVTLDQLDVALKYLQLAEKQLTEEDYISATMAIKRKVKEL